MGTKKEPSIKVRPLLYTYTVYGGLRAALQYLHYQHTGDITVLH